MVTYGNNYPFMETSMMNLAIYGNPQMMLNLWCFPQNNLKSVQKFIQFRRIPQPHFDVGSDHFDHHFLQCPPQRCTTSHISSIFIHPSIAYIWVISEVSWMAMPAVKSGRGTQSSTHWKHRDLEAATLSKTSNPSQNSSQFYARSAGWSNSSRSCSCEMQNLQS